MILGALIDLAGEYAGLRAGLARLARGRFEFRKRKVVTGSLAAIKIDVVIRARDEVERNFREISALIERVLAGEEVIIGKAGKPVAKLVPLKAAKRARTPGFLKGRIRIAADFDAPLPDAWLDAFEGKR